MCGALVYCCLRYGAWDTNLLKNILTLRYSNGSAYNVVAVAAATCNVTLQL